MSPSAGPPPVERSAVATVPAERIPVAVQNYTKITEQLRANNSAEAKAIRAMFGGNKQLMDRFLSVTFSLLATESDLLEKATTMSIVESIKQAARLGLEPMTEEAAIVRYGSTATLLPMYRGYLKRIRNSGLVQAVDAVMVYENDEFEYGTNEMGHWFRHVPAKSLFKHTTDAETGEVTTEQIAERGDYWGAYAFARMHSGFTFLRVMEVAEINHVRDTYGNKESRSGRPLPWLTSYDQMALKTVIRRLAKALPQEAVGAELLEIERQADEAIERSQAAAQSVADAISVELAEIKQLAVSTTRPTQDVPSAPEPEKPTEVAEPEKPEQSDPPEKVEQPDGPVCGKPSPYTEGEICLLPPSHEPPHGVGRSTWL